MADPKLLTGTLDELVVGEGESVRLRGTVLGDAEVQPGGSLVHEGLITGLLYVEDGGRLYLHGRVERVEWENANDVEVHGAGRPPGGFSTLPFTGPDGWGAIDAVWGRSATDLDKAVESARLGSYLQQRKQDITEDCFRAAAATVAIGGQTDAQLWALLAAAVFNPAESARIRNARRRQLTSPEDCRERLAWDELTRYFDEPPELFARLLPHRDRTGRSLAFDCYEALSAVTRAVLAVDGATDAAVTTVESFRTVLREQAASASRDSSPNPRSKSTTRSRPGAKTAATRPGSSTTTRTRGAGARSPRRSAICTETDPVDAALCELDSLIGLASVKEEIRRLGNFAAIQRQRVLSGFPETEITRHLVMTGNPGTGKTTVARLLGAIYFGYGLLQTDAFVEVTRSELVDKYIGKTDENVKDAFDRAAGGVLFIDEAYSLAPRSPSDVDYGRQAIDALVPLMENRRREVMVVAAGYPKPMQDFLRANPGLDGRFGTKIHFPDYSDDELLAILRRFCDAGQFELMADTEDAAMPVFAALRRRMGQRFDNARMVRRLFEKTVQRQHDRLYEESRRQGRQPSAGALMELRAVDLPRAEELVPEVDTETAVEV